MRKQWFGDSRDYVKWSCVRAEAGDTFAVVYGPMLRNDSFSGEKLDQGVVDFFDRHKDFSALSELFPAGYEHLLDIYERKKSADYFDRLARLIRRVQNHSQVVVFLDPDTGVAPKSGAGDEHLNHGDIRKVCELLRTGEKLIVYQHASRSENWRKIAHEKLAPLAIESRTILSQPFYEDGTAKDVCFFTFTKS
jgi:hypothetical protein